jgi:23S rRNA pseudouridine1911/1915/1917 synthase
MSRRTDIATERIVTVVEADAGRRLDVVLAAHLADISRSRLKALILEGRVSLAGRTIGDPGVRVKPGTVLHICLPEPTPATPKPEAIALDIVYEDQALIVIDKPAGLVVHPGAGHATGTLVNALIAHCGDSLSGIGGVRRPGIVHRLDKDTSGLLVVAKTDAAHQALSAQFAAHGADGRLVRTYRALVWGVPRHRSGMVDAPLARAPRNRIKMAVATHAASRRAVTRYALREILPGGRTPPAAALLDLDLETGRTHQIRVHMAHIGHPVMGDRTYGTGFAASARALAPPARNALADLGRQALHAAVLGFQHPETGRPMRFESPLPTDMARLLELLRTPAS